MSGRSSTSGWRERSDVYAAVAQRRPPRAVPARRHHPAAAASERTRRITRRPAIKGEYRLVTLFTRTGQITTERQRDLFDNAGRTRRTQPDVNVYNVNHPFLQAQQGVTGGQQ